LSRTCHASGDPLLVNRLVYAKYLYGLACQGLESPSALVASEALLRLHDSIEIFQGIVLDSTGVPKERHGKFMEFWKKVKEGTPGNFTPPDQDRFQALNDMRAALKHSATVPNLSQLRALSAVVPSFFAKVSAEVLDLDFSQISLADLIEDAEARNRTKRAEAAISSGDFQTALSELAQALDFVLRGSEPGVPESLRHSLRPFGEPSLSDYDIRRLASVLPDEASQAAWKIFRRLESQILELRRALEMLTRGIDIQRYRRFTYLMPLVRRFQSGRVEVRFAPFQVALLRREDADFCLQFVVDTALAIQIERFPILDRHASSKLRTVAQPTVLYGVSPDNSITPIGEIPKHYQLMGRPCIVPSLVEVWRVTYEGQEGYIRLSDAVPVDTGTDLPSKSVPG